MVRLFVFFLLIVAVFAAYENGENRRHGNEIGNENHKIGKATKTHENAIAEENSQQVNNNLNSPSSETLVEEIITEEINTDSITPEPNNSNFDSSLSDSSGTVESEEIIDENKDGRNTYAVEETINESPCAIHGFEGGCICRVGDMRCINIHQGMFSFT